MIFVDTGPLIARYLERDGQHQRALALWQQLASTEERLFTSNFVLDEFFTLLGRRAGNVFAAERAKNSYASARLRILRPQAEDELGAVELFEKFADQRISFTDCVSFALMRRYRIPQALTFDHHFERAGFSLYG